MVKKSGFPTAAGVLIIVGACICCVLGILYMVVFVFSEEWYRLYYAYYISGVFGLLGFAFGLTGGIFALKRRMFPLVIVGTALMLMGGIFSFVEPVIGVILGVPVVLLAILGVIFTAISKREFV